MNNVFAISLSSVVIGTFIYYIIYKFNYSTKKVLIDINTPVALKVIAKELLTTDSYLIRCELPTSEHTLGLPVGNHVYINANIDGEDIMRAYTPISLDTDFGLVELAIKVYRSNIHPNFPEGGVMSRHIEDLKIGDSLNISGPAGRFVYKGMGKMKIGKVNGTEKVITNITMIAGGSGITPMFQIIKYISTLKNDETKISLIYANQTEQSIMLKEQLQALKIHLGEDQFRLTYILSFPQTGWMGLSGHIDLNILKLHAFKHGPNSIALLCGKEEMCYSMYNYLKELEYQEENIYIF